MVVVVGGGLSLCICCKNQRSHCKSNLPPRIIVGTLMEPSIGPMLSGFVCCPNFLVRVYLEYYGMKRLGDFLMLRLPWFGNFLNICIILPFEFGISKAGTWFEIKIYVCKRRTIPWLGPRIFRWENQIILTIDTHTKPNRYRNEWILKEINQGMHETTSSFSFQDT